MTGRVHHRAVYGALKTGTRVLLNELGRAEAASRAIGVRSGESLRQYQDAGRDVFAPADIIADLEAFADFPHITAALASANGYLIIPGPERLAAGGTASLALAEAGEAVTRIATVYADGACNHLEAGPARRQLAETIYALLSLDAEIAAQHPDSGPPLGGGS